MYDDNSFLFEGKHKFTTLKNIPAKDLLNIGKFTKDEDLKLYVKSNLEKLLVRAQQEKLVKNLLAKCDKISYSTEKEATFEVLRIMKKRQENKKPIRIYKYKCEAYHLTSRDFII